MPRTQRAQETRRRLLDEGVAVMLEQGYHGAGLLSVLSRVGVPKGSFYNYFASKEAFAAEVVRHYAAAFDRRLEAMVGEAGQDAPAALRRFFRDLAREFEAGGCTGGCLVGNLSGELEEPDECRRAIRAALIGWRDRLAAAVALGQEQRKIRDDLAASEVADFILNSWEGAVLRMKAERAAAPLQQWIRLVLEGWLRP